jgi:hypothetical protein
LTFDDDHDDDVEDGNEYFNGVLLRHYSEISVNILVASRVYTLYNGLNS